MKSGCHRGCRGARSTKRRGPHSRTEGSQSARRGHGTGSPRTVWMRVITWSPSVPSLRWATVLRLPSSPQQHTRPPQRACRHCRRLPQLYSKAAIAADAHDRCIAARVGQEAAAAAEGHNDAIAAASLRGAGRGVSAPGPVGAPACPRRCVGAHHIGATVAADQVARMVQRAAVAWGAAARPSRTEGRRPRVGSDPHIRRGGASAPWAAVTPLKPMIAWPIQPRKPSPWSLPVV